MAQVDLMVLQVFKVQVPELAQHQAQAQSQALVQE
jgi:hypothetical protein